MGITTHLWCVVADMVSLVVDLAARGVAQGYDTVVATLGIMSKKHRLGRGAAVILVGFAALLGGCGAGLEQATLRDGGPVSDGTAAGVAVDHLPPVSACTSGAPAPRALRRLSQAELNNTVADLLGSDAPQTTDVFNNDPVIYGFGDMYGALQVRDFTATAVENYAEACAAYAKLHVATLSACNTADDTCRSSFIAAFGQRAFRQPLSAAQVAQYLPLMQSAADFPSGVAVVVSAMLQSPYFLYRPELGVQQGATYTLSPYEIASELSYLYTASMPDAPLLQAAAQNSLATPAQLSAQATRLIATPRGHAAVDAFFMQWLQISGLQFQSRMETDSTTSTTLDDATKAAMKTEATMLVEDVVFAKHGSFADLLAANYSFLSQPLATFYGAGGASGPTFVAVPAATSKRPIGVLGLGGVISAASQATYASPTLRGRMVRMRFLCGSLGSPPPGVPPLGEPVAKQTLRDRFVAHASIPECASCHTQMDPLGFTFGNFDTVGRERPNHMEMGLPVDTSGELSDSGSEASTQLADLNALSTALSTDPAAQACLSRHWAMYGLGSVSWNQDACTYQAMAGIGTAAQGNLVQTMVGLTQVPSFVQRTADP